MVAAQDLKSCDFGRAGSSPALGTKKQALQPVFLLNFYLFLISFKIHPPRGCKQKITKTI